MQKALITILGTIGMKKYDGTLKDKAIYNTTDGLSYEHYNTFALLIEKYSQEYKIIPFFTEYAKKVNKEILEFHKQNNEKFANLDIEALFDDKYFIEDENDFEAVFASINKEVSSQEYDKIIVDVSHGFRHLPILATIDVVIENFKDADKIEQILFAKEVIKEKKYEIIDLKDYLDIANIAFILSAFNRNYTVANHIESKKFPDLIKALQDFSDDMMALNIVNLFKKTAPNLIAELEKIDPQTAPAIAKQSQDLKNNINSILRYSKAEGYRKYYGLGRILFAKNYMLLALAIIYEGIRLYVASEFEKKYPEFYNTVCQNERENIYDICNFFRDFLRQDYKQLNLVYRDSSNFDSNQKINLKESLKKGKKQYIIQEKKFNEIKASFKNKDAIERLSEEMRKSRNELVHVGNASFEEVKKTIKDFIDRFEKIIIS